MIKSVIMLRGIISDYFPNPRFLKWAMVDPEASKIAGKHNFAVLSESMVERVQEQVLNKFLCGGVTVESLLQEQIDAENRESEKWILYVTIAGTITLL